MAKFHLDRSAIGTFDDADLPSDETLDEMVRELVELGDLLQIEYSTRFLHLILNRYLKQLRQKGDARKAIAAELFNVVQWRIYNHVVREIEEEIPYGEIVEEET